MSRSIGRQAKTENFFRERKLEVCFYASYLYLNEFTGYVDLLDFHENWPESSNLNKHENSKTPVYLQLLEIRFTGVRVGEEV